MNKKTLLFLGLFSISGLFLSAQKNNNNPRNFGNSIFYEQIKEQAQENNGKVKCATYEYDSYLNSVNPEKERIGQFESWIAPKIEQYKKKRQTMKVADGTNVITIPVVVHVVHDNKAYGVGENITDEQVISQITVLNQDFRRILGTPGYNTSDVGADVEIEFCLAQRTPAGQVTNGINRLNMSTPVFDIPGWGEFPTWTMEDIEFDLKPSTVWEPEEYLNIWVIDNIQLGMIAGYAQFPVSSGLEGLEGGGISEEAYTDGVVISHFCFGSSDIYPEGTYEAPYDKGRTTTHEVGHWLGLRHIWGDKTSCVVDAIDSFNDYCLDTPPANTANQTTQGCFQISTCSADSMLENYMDYTGDSCQNIFTEDQKMRMQTVLENSPRRNSLLTSSGCLVPQEFDLKVGAIDLGGQCDSQVSPVVILSNVGTSTTITSVEISYGIEGETTQTYNWTGTLDSGVDTEVTLPLVDFQQTSNFIVNVVSINGGVDDNTLNNVKTAQKIIPSSFNSSMTTLSLTTDNYGVETTWTLVNEAGVLISQGGNYSSNQTYSQTFELVDGCYNFTIYDTQGDGICCDYGNGSYSLTADSEVIITGGSFGASQSTSFIISATAASVDTKNIFDKVTLYPNPTNSILNVVVGSSDLPENIVIYNMLGQIVRNQNVNNTTDLSLDVNSFANGVYLIKIEGQGQSKTMRFIKQ